MIFGIKNYRQYLLGRKFVIRTDHAALAYLMTAKDLIGQQARWVDLLSEFDFTIQHRPGVSHTNADALSRKIPCELGGTNCLKCHKHIPDTYELSDGPGCSRILAVPTHDTLRAQPVRTRAQARRETVEEEQSDLTPNTQIRTDIWNIPVGTGPLDMNVTGPNRDRRYCPTAHRLL